MRIVLFTGKGGVGKTTTAAATAVAAARAGLRTLVLSTDAAHSLGDALGVPLPDAPATGPVDVEPRLRALHASAGRTLDPSWRLVQDYLLRVLDSVGVDPVVADELTALPGADEVAALLALHEHAGSGEHDLVVVDCAPTAETLRLLALPEALAWHLERLLPAQRGLLRTLRPAATAAAGVPLPGPEVVETVRGWLQRMREVQRLLTGQQASVRLVTTPERVVVAESRRTWTSLSLYGVAVDGVVVNRLLPDAQRAARTGGAPDPWLAGWNAAQQEGLREVAESFAGVPVTTTPYLAREPVGPDALAELAAAGGVDPQALLSPVPRHGLAVKRMGEEFVLSLDLPLADRGDVDLKRRDAELLVSVGGHRRVLALPAVLTRCTVRGAAVRDGTLRVRFTPTPGAWPASLAAAGGTRG
ncbi:ArsA family ATPase [Lapillicoccus jejuensis]|uniref:Arsenite efflux ATP-binding protein ArsA n=1 Tax=Lapillicoccus jejuensis TaxID=402171 RepID=A0A542E5M4_9MICO|nr:ArsA family ATPase [Lapillicoccus jejuensis]TQJ10642.1 arsenite efflux ATP-binding protein ArsA [Lapillicoccus jejuensis]